MSQQALPQLFMYRKTLNNLPPLTPPLGYSVRSFRPGDEAAWDRICEESFVRTDLKFDTWLKLDPSYTPERTLFVVNEKDEPVAMSHAFHRPEYGATCGYVHMVGALPSEKGKGLGYAVVLATLYKLREEGFTSAILSTDDFRLPAIATYLKLGFDIQNNHPSIPVRWAAVMEQLNKPRKGHDPIDLWEGKPVPLFDETITDQKRPSIKPFLIDDGKVHGAVIVCPGGGYAMKADHEADPIAEMLNRQGVHAFVLDYRVTPYRFPAPLLDAQRAIRYVRYYAKDLGVDPNHIGILGFSAGGHLTVTAATHYDAGDPISVDPVERVSCRPDAFVPCYAVVSFNQFRHEGSMLNMLGPDCASRERRLFLSGECNVTDDTPPAFIWHTAEDGVVPVEGALHLAEQLGYHNIPYSLHIFPFGPHGIALAQNFPLAPVWPDLLGQWLHHMGF